MFDLVQKNQFLFKILLGLLALTFLGWGVEGYVTSVDNTWIASVDSEKIHEQALREVRIGNDPVSESSPLEVKKSALEYLISERVRQLALRDQRLQVTDQALIQHIQQDPQFQVNGRFSREVYQRILAERGMTGVQYELARRRELQEAQLMMPLSVGSLVSRTTADRLASLRMEARDVQLIQLPIAPWLSQVKVEPAAVQAWYDKNKARYEVPAQAQFEYVVFGPESVGQKLTLSEDEIKQAYIANPAAYTQIPFKARHILIAADAKKSAADKEKAKAQAEALRQQVVAAPARFEELAKTQSQDVITAANGGDLGEIKPGVLGSAFDAAVFKLLPGQISAVVETEHGYHVVQLVEGPQFDKIKDEVAAAVKKQKATQLVVAQLESFKDTVYNKPDSLKPVVDKHGLTVQLSDWISKGGTPPSDARLANPKVLAALFADDVLKHKNNTEAIEISPSTWLAARLKELRPARIKPLDEVRTEVEAAVRQAEAWKLLEKDALAKLESFKKGDAGLTPVNATITRGDNKDIARAVAQAVFVADAGKLPTFTTVPQPEAGVVTLVKLLKVNTPPVSEAERAQALMQLGYARQPDLEQAYVATLAQKYDIERKIERMQTAP